nr:MAG TPA: hypothetical protein [Caudoviricetes sp.]
MKTRKRRRTKHGNHMERLSGKIETCRHRRTIS